MDMDYDLESQYEDRFLSDADGDDYADSVIDNWENESEDLDYTAIDEEAAANEWIDMFVL